MTTYGCSVSSIDRDKFSLVLPLVLGFMPDLSIFDPHSLMMFITVVEHRAGEFMYSKDSSLCPFLFDHVRVKPTLDLVDIHFGQVSGELITNPPSPQKSLGHC